MAAMLNELSAKNGPQPRSGDPRGEIGNILQVDAGLRISEVQVFGGQQAMALGPHVSQRKHHILGKLALDSEVVLGGVLGPQLGFKFAEQQDGTEVRTSRSAFPAAG